MTAKRWPTLGDFVIWGVVIFLVAIVLTAQCGCKTVDRQLPCPEPTPTVVTETELFPCVIQVVPLPPYAPPVYPPFPGEEGGDEELKTWALEMGQAIEQRDALCAAREEAWQAIVAEMNASGPSCADHIPPTPP